jgi:hypothetical protein
MLSRKRHRIVVRRSWLRTQTPTYSTQGREKTAAVFNLSVLDRGGKEGVGSTPARNCLKTTPIKLVYGNCSFEKMIHVCTLL